MPTFSQTEVEKYLCSLVSRHQSASSNRIGLCLKELSRALERSVLEGLAVLEKEARLCDNRASRYETASAASCATERLLAIRILAQSAAVAQIREEELLQ